jgi:hypothetical protein
MKKINPIVWKETKYIALWVLIFSALMQAVFLILGYFMPTYPWTLGVLWGNLLGGGAAVGNFFLMAVGVVRAMEKEEKEAKQTLKLSSTMRFLGLFLIMLVGVLVPVFNTWATVIPLLFPRVAIALRPLILKEPTPQKEDSYEN